MDEKVVVAKIAIPTKDADRWYEFYRAFREGGKLFLYTKSFFGEFVAFFIKILHNEMRIQSERNDKNVCVG
ncbi:MAG: hypothetical protein NC430_11255 [bacterium]|nr:hypothetical protein [bacterium]MCM1424568.1 hypothetical protein [bacterium]